MAGELTTTNYGWIKPTVGSSTDAWGGYINTDLDGIDTTVFGMLSKAGGTMTGALTVSQTAGIVGTTTNNNANAGAVGEYIVADRLTNVAMSNGVSINITSISLTAGDWDVNGGIYVVFSAAVGVSVIGSVSLTSGTIGGGLPAYNGYCQLNAPSMTNVALQTGTARMSLAATTTVYLVAYSNFGSGTCNGQGSISARRVR